MISVMIVEDEYLERILILKSFDWAENGYEILGTFGNGNEAIEFYKKSRPEIVLTDINMPYCNGIQLSKALKEINPFVEIIIITGYDDFQYAQKAIHIGVTSFILKPIDKAELCDAITKCTKNIKQKQESEYYTLNLVTQLNTNKILLIESFLQRLLNGRVGSIEFTEKIQDYDLQFLKTNICCINIKHKGLDIEQVKSCFQDKICWVFTHYSGNYIVLLWQDTTNYIKEKDFITSTLKKLNTSSSNLIAVSDVHSGDHGVLNSYRQTLRIFAKVAIIKSPSKIFYLEDDITIPTNKHINIFNYLRQYKEAILECNLSNAIKAFQDTTDIFISNDYTRYINKLFFDFISTTSLLMWENGYDISDYEIGKNIYDLLPLEEDLFLQLELMENFISHSVNYFKTKCCYKNNKNMDLILNYIDQNYKDCTLTLKTIARNFYMNESYLSRVFKKHVGVSLSEYIIKKRMQEAGVLLKTSDYKNYEIAEKIGIYDPHYFGQCFKKYYGCTPNQFKSKNSD